MHIGIIGAGTVGKTIARHLTTAGHQVAISRSRGPERLTGLVGELGPSVKAGSKEEALQGELVIFCVNWTHAQAGLKGTAWSGRIVVDATNAHNDDPPDISLEGVNRSRAASAKTGRALSELVAEWAPGARVVNSISDVPIGGDRRPQQGQAQDGHLHLGR